MNEHRPSPAGPPRRGARAYGAIVGVLAVAAAGSWIAARTAAPESVPVACSRPAAGSVMPSTELVGVAPAPPSAIPIRVVNGGGASGAATSAADALSSLGFAQAPDPVGNDPLSPAQDMDCHGQVRFPAGDLPKAATMHLVLPCFELVRADRPDGSVEVSLGSGFTSPDDSEQIRGILGALDQGGDPPAGALDGIGHATC